MEPTPHRRTVSLQTPRCPHCRAAHGEGDGKTGPKVHRSVKDDLGRRWLATCQTCGQKILFWFK